MAQDRGELDTAQEWYRKSLAISEELGNRPGMALTFSQSGLLAKQQGKLAEALVWTVRCISLFDEIPHTSTKRGTRTLARLTSQLGMAALEDAWRAVTGEEVPKAAHDYLTGLCPSPTRRAGDWPGRVKGGSGRRRNGATMRPFMDRSQRLGGPLRAESSGRSPVMTLPRSAADVLAGHVLFEIEAIDRMYLNLYQPRLQHGAGIASFFVGHRGHRFASSALMAPMTRAFTADIGHFTAARGRAGAS